MANSTTSESTSTPVTGKAIRYKGHGGYDVIEIVERSVRPPAAGEVRIRVKAAAVNPTDGLLRAMAQVVMPCTPGMDAAGVIESVGEGVTQLRVGEEVMAAVQPTRPEGGAQAAHIVVPAASVLGIPKGTSLQQASTLPMNGLTALYAFEIAGLKAGQTLAVSGGAGLLAHFAIAAAKRMGVKVIADAKPEETELVRSYGADVVIPRGPAFSEEVRKIAPEGADVLLDTALLAESSFPAIRDGGVYVPVRGWGDSPSQRGIQIKPVFVSQALERTDLLVVLRELVESGAIKLRVAGEFAPEAVADAQRQLAAGGLRGRSVIIF